MRVVSESGDRLLTPGEVADLFREDPKTINRWAQQGRLPAIHTLGGHRRYRSSDIEPHLTASKPDNVSHLRLPPARSKQS
jgi:excisionase family DNA binding protein